MKWAEFTLISNSDHSDKLGNPGEVCRKSIFYSLYLPLWDRLLLVRTTVIPVWGRGLYPLVFQVRKLKLRSEICFRNTQLVSHSLVLSSLFLLIYLSTFYTGWTSIIWSYEIWNTPMSETLWVPNDATCGKFHTMKHCFMHKIILKIA
jgi:hypothetical protein